MKITALVLAVTAAVLLGCRTVWVHPEASQQKYTEDLYRCRYGAEPPSPEQIRTGDVPTLAKRRDWKECMALLGWDTKVGMRWNEPYSQ